MASQQGTVLYSWRSSTSIWFPFPIGLSWCSDSTCCSIETCILLSVKQIASPGWMHETSAWGLCTGKTQRMGWGGRWEGGSGWRTHVNPWLIHVNVWQKPLQYCKVISLQLIKINGKKKVCLAKISSLTLSFAFPHYY